MYMYVYIYIYIYIHTYMCLFNNVDFGGLDPRRLSNPKPRHTYHGRVGAERRTAGRRGEVRNDRT